MQVYIHAGFHKTGTTSFQNLIRANRSNVPHGVRFVLAGDPLANDLRAALRGYHRHPDAQSESRVHICLTMVRDDALRNGTDRLAISLEAFCGLIPDAGDEHLYPYASSMLALASRVFEQSPVTLMFTLRDATSWVRSVHAHRMRKPGFTTPLEVFSRAEKFGSIDWDTVITRLTKDLPVAVRVSHLDATKDSRLGPGSDLLPLFLEPEILSAWQPVPPANIGLVPAAVRLGENGLVAKLPEPLRRFIIRQFNSIASRF